MTADEDVIAEKTVRDAGPYWAVYDGRGGVWVQRKEAIKATDNPMNGYESVICQLAARVHELEALSRVGGREA